MEKETFPDGSLFRKFNDGNKVEGIFKWEKLLLQRIFKEL